MKIALNNWKCVLKAFNHQTVFFTSWTKVYTSYTSKILPLSKYYNKCHTFNDQERAFQHIGMKFTSSYSFIKCVPYNISQETVIAEQSLNYRTKLLQLAPKLLVHGLLTMVCASYHQHCITEQLMIPIISIESVTCNVPWTKLHQQPPDTSKVTSALQLYLGVDVY